MLTKVFCRACTPRLALRKLVFQYCFYVFETCSAESQRSGHCNAKLDTDTDTLTTVDTGCSWVMDVEADTLVQADLGRCRLLLADAG